MDVWRVCATGEGLSASSGGFCITAGDVTAEQCGNAGRVRLAGTGCVTEANCRTGNRAVSGNSCVTGTAQLCFEDDGRGFSDGSCASPSETNCMAGGFTFDMMNALCVMTRMTNIPSMSLTGITDEATAKALFASDRVIFIDDTAVMNASDMEKISNEYQNQPSLAQVKAADAYARNVGSLSTSTYDLNLGQGSNISVLTNRRFDPTHPEFSSSHSDASYDTLTRFLVNIGSGVTVNIQDAITSYFSKDDDERVQVYRDDFVPSGGTSSFYVTIPVIALNDGTNTMAFETISRNDLNFDDSGADADRAARAEAIRTEFLTFMRGIVSGTRVILDPVNWVKGSKGYYLNLSNVLDFIEIADNPGSNNSNFNHIGRVYGETSNIASYQIVADSSTTFQDDAGDDLSGITGINLASDADMGLLALINGLLDPSRSDTQLKLFTNTHGIAPLAYLHVFSSFQAGQTNFNGTDLIYRARGIDVGRDRDGDGNLIADDTRNIVLVHNTIAEAAIPSAANQTNVNNASNSNAYSSFYDALIVGVADTAEQDIYVFAAEDGRTTDAGLLASLAAAQEDTDNDGTVDTRLFEDYSIVVVAAGSGTRTPCGDLVKDFCITAPGAYNYVNKETVGGDDNTAYDDADSLVAGSVTANAAASLVAGGLAVLESIFGDQLTSSSELIDRLFLTASKDFDLDGDAANANDYTDIMWWLDQRTAIWCWLNGSCRGECADSEDKYSEFGLNGRHQRGNRKSVVYDTRQHIC